MPEDVSWQACFAFKPARGRGLTCEALTTQELAQLARISGLSRVGEDDGSQIMHDQGTIFSWPEPRHTSHHL